MPLNWNVAQSRQSLSLVLPYHHFKKKKKKKQHNVNVRHETSAGILELHYKNAIEMYRPVNKLALVNISWIKNWTFCQETSTALDDDKDPIPPHP